MHEVKRIARNDLIISILCFIVGVIFGICNASATGMEVVLSVIVSGAMLGGLRYGWKMLTFITPNIFLIMPIIGWVIFFLVKFILSLIIAPFAFVIKTIMNIVVLCSKN